MLNDEQIIERIKKPLNADKILKCRRLEKDLKRYMDGLGYTNPIGDDFIDAWESEAQKDLKKHLDQCPTIPVAKLIRDELNKGIKTDSATEKIEPEVKQLDETLAHIWKDSDIEFFINSFLVKSIDTDFCSFIVVTKGKLLEVDGKKYEVRDESIKANDGDFTPYAIYISINDVVDFKSKGKTTDYLIYKFERESEKEIYYRFIDDTRDLLVKEKSGKFEIVGESIILHEIGYTPAKQISDLYLISSILPEVKGSQMSHVVGEFASYEVQYKDLKISEVRHAFPKYYSLALTCPVCEGEKKIMNPDPDSKQSQLFIYHDSSVDVGTTIRCPYCNGDGSLVSLNSKEAIKLPAKIGDQQFNLTGAPAGFVQFPSESLSYQRESLETDESRLIFNATGNKNIVIARLQTATEVDTNTRSLESRINDRQGIIEGNVNFVAKTAAKIMKFDVEYEYKFQRNVSYKSTETLYDEIEKAEKTNMPQSYIDELKRELTQIRFNQEEVIETINSEIDETETEKQSNSVQSDE